MIVLEEFIQLIKQHEIIWNFHHSFHKDRFARSVAWRKISNQTKVPIEECKKKWRYLKDAFKRERFKHFPLDETEEDSNISHTWKYYKHLSFLKLRRPPQDIDTSAAENFVSSLIESVRISPLLWDRNHENYRAISAKNGAWNSISLEMGMSVYDCKKKWKYLRDAYVRTKAKMIRSGGGDAAAASERDTWRYFKYLTFLDSQFTEEDIQRILSYKEPENPSMLEKVPVKLDPLEDCDQNDYYLTYKTDIFVSLVKRNQILWNQYHSNFKDIKKKTEIWNEISRQIDISVMDCKKKWKYLRNTFYRDKTKSIFDNTEQDSSKRCKILSELKFLDESHCAVNPDPFVSYQFELDKNAFKTEFFISCIRNSQELWNPYNDGSHDRRLRASIWERVAKKVEMTVCECKKKWKYLKDAFMREHKKRTLTGNNWDESNEGWKYYDQLLFLIGKWESKFDPVQFITLEAEEVTLPNDVTTSEVDTVIETMDAQEPAECPEELCSEENLEPGALHTQNTLEEPSESDHLIEPHESPNKLRASQAAKRSRSSSNSDWNTNEIGHQPPKMAKLCSLLDEDDDEDAFFCASLNRKLKKFPLKIKNELKIQLVSILNQKEEELLLPN